MTSSPASDGGGGGRRAELPTVFMPVEIKVREFRPKLLVAARAARRGLRAYVGSKPAIRAAMTSRPGPSGLYFAKGGEGLEVIAEARGHCAYVAVQDEEIGPAMSRAEVANAWRTRYHRPVNDLIDRVLLFSAAHQPILAREQPDLADKAVVTGWPRFDLWRAGYRQADERTAVDIRRRHGDFALYVSNFKINTEAQRQHKIAAARANAERLVASRHVNEPGATTSGGVVTDAAANEYGTHTSHRLAAYRRAIDLLRQLAPDSPLPIIVRPHPAENPAVWRADLAGIANITVIFEGEIDPWLLAARGMLHTGCTTAVQAFHYGLPSGYLAGVGYLPDDFAETASRRLSTALPSRDEIDKFLGDPRFAPDESTATEPLDGPLVSDRIVDVFESFALQPERPIRLPVAQVVRSWLAAGKVEVIRRLRRRQGDFYGTNAQPKLPGGLHAAEARRFLASIPGTDGLVVREVRHNLLCVEPR